MVMVMAMVTWVYHLGSVRLLAFIVFRCLCFHNCAINFPRSPTSYHSAELTTTLLFTSLWCEVGAQFVLLHWSATIPTYPRRGYVGIVADGPCCCWLPPTPRPVRCGGIAGDADTPHCYTVAPGAAPRRDTPHCCIVATDVDTPHCCTVASGAVPCRGTPHCCTVASGVAPWRGTPHCCTVASDADTPHRCTVAPGAASWGDALFAVGASSVGGVVSGLQGSAVAAPIDAPSGTSS